MIFVTSSEKVPIAERKQNVTLSRIWKLKLILRESAAWASDVIKSYCFFAQAELEFAENYHEKMVNGAQKVWKLWMSNLWQRETTQTSLIIKFSALGKLSYINFSSIRINQVNLKMNLCLVLWSKMVFYEELCPVIFHFEIQKKYLKHLKNWIYLKDLCVNYQLQPHNSKSLNIFTIRPP